MKAATTSQGIMFLVSLVLHAGVGASIATLPRRPAKTKMVVTLNTVKKPKPLPPPEPPPPPPEPETPPPPPPPPPPEPPKARPKPKAQPVKADTPPPKAGPAAPAAFDSGMTLGSGGAGSFELPAGSTGEARPAPAPASTGSALPAAPRKVKAADSCTEPVVKAKPLELVQPSYPETERSSGTRGKVRVEIQLDASGGVRSARVIQALAPAFDEAALKAARKFRFSPATRCGKPVPHKFNLSLRFEL